MEEVSPRSLSTGGSAAPVRELAGEVRDVKARKQGPLKLGRRAIILWLLTGLVGLGAAWVALGLDRLLLQTRNYYLVNQQGNAYNQGMTRLAHRRAASGEGLPVAVIPIREQTRDVFAEPVPAVVPGVSAPLTFRRAERAFHARVLRNLRRLGARTIVFDLVFDEDDPMDPHFARAIGERRDVVLAAMNVQRVLRGGEVEQTANLQYPAPPLLEAAAGIGVVNVALDRDRAIRRFRWSFPGWDPVTLEDTQIPALGVAAAALHTGVEPGKALTGEFFPRGTFLGKPVSWMEERGPGGTARVSYISFFGPTGAPAGPNSVVPYEDVFRAFDAETPAADRERLKGLLKGKLVIVGNETDLAQDWHEVPVISPSEYLDDAQQMPGMEIQAAVAQTALSGRYVQVAPETARLLLVLGTCLLVALVGRLINPWPFLFLSGAGLVGLVGGSIWLLEAKSLWLEPVTAGVGLLAAFAGETTVMFFGERRDRLYVRKQLSRHVGPGVAETLAEGEWPDFGGETREITMLFSDLQGFTSLSERMSSQEICSLLNRYFGVVFPIVFKYGGTIDKLMGDGMMAYFGWPQQDADHAARAVRCAVEIQAALAEWQQSPEMRDAPPLRTRIGIHTGEATVGQIGFGERREFTVIGDVVNVASRLEGMNKEFGTAILISGSTLTAAGELAPTVYRGDVAVRGRREPTRVYSVETAPAAAVPVAAATSAA
jgi:adenylate cyclase